jgi:hypothetical protein
MIGFAINRILVEKKWDDGHVHRIKGRILTGISSTVTE